MGGLQCNCNHKPEKEMIISPDENQVQKENINTPNEFTAKVQEEVQIDEDTLQDSRLQCIDPEIFPNMNIHSEKRVVRNMNHNDDNLVLVKNQLASNSNALTNVRKQISEYSFSPKPPLEIINEMNGDVCSEKLTGEKEKETQKDSCLCLNNVVSEMPEPERVHTIPSKSKSSSHRTDQISLTNRDKKHEHVNSLPVVGQYSGRSNTSGEDHMKRVSESKKSYKEEDNNKNNFSNKEIRETWRDMLITAIIPENKLINAEENDILIMGEFFKYSKSNENLRGAQVFSSKFLLLTRSELRYDMNSNYYKRVYRSREVVLRMQNPLQRIPLFNIIASDRMNLPSNRIKDKTKTYFTFYVEYITSHGNILDISGKESIQNDSTNLSAIHSKKPSRSKMKDL